MFALDWVAKLKKGVNSIKHPGNTNEAGVRLKLLEKDVKMAENICSEL